MEKRTRTGLLIAGGATLTVALIAAIREAMTPSPSAGPGGKRIALIGDSYAVGLGPPLSSLASAAGVQFQSWGAVGTTPLQWATRSGCGKCDSWLPAFDPNVVLVSLGVNDLGQVTPNAAYYRTITQRIQAMDAICIWIEPPVLPNRPLTAVRQTIESLTSMGAQIIAAANIPIAQDGIHPVSYTGWATSLWSQIPP